MPDKIAFLFLTIDNINCDAYWNNYFDLSRSNIYVHPKNPSEVTLPWLKKNIISENVSTAWGHIVNAELCLLREAMKDPDNKKFVTISESCIPIKTFDDFYKDVMKKEDINKSMIKIMHVSKYDFEARIKTQPQYTKYTFTKHYARFCLARGHVEKLLDLPYSDHRFFCDMHVGDEFFLTLLFSKCNIDSKEIIDRAVTFDNWGSVQKEVRKINQKIKELQKSLKNNESKIYDLKRQRDKINANPKSYIKVSQLDISEALGTGCYFWRKFPKNSEICMKKHILKSVSAKPLYLIHIPKAAGTAVEEICYTYGECVGQCYTNRHHSMRPIDEKYYKMSPWHVPLQYFSKNKVKEIYESHIIFAIVRNPYDRILSDFRFWHDYYELRPELQKDKYHKFLIKNLKNINTFVDTGINTLHYDGHFIPMAEFIDESENITILRHESLNKDFNKFLTDNSIDIPQDLLKIPTVNVSKSHRSISIKDFSKSSLKKINKIYKNDFIRFKYNIVT